MATRKDVAKLAGVSETTVTRVTNNSGYVSPENRAKVQAAIEQLQYKPNLVAKGLRTKTTKQILYLMPDVNNAYYLEVFSGIEDYARGHGYSVVISRHFDRDMLYQRQFDGVILSGSYLQYDPDLDKDVEMSFEQIQEVDFPVPCVNTSNTQSKPGIQQAAEYFYAQGHRRLSMILRPTFKGDLRMHVFRERFEKLGGVIHEEDILIIDLKNEPEDVGAFMLDFIRPRMGEVTGAFMHNDVLALKLIAAMHAKELWVPHDFSLIGYDDIMFAAMSAPALTTIHMPKYEMGREAARRLIHTIENRPYEPVMLQAELTIRESVKKLKVEE